MRWLLVLLVSSCAAEPVVSDPEPQLERRSACVEPRPKNNPAGPFRFDWRGIPGDGHNAAIRELISEGFNIELSDEDSGVIRASRFAIDQANSDFYECRRLEKYASLAQGNQLYAVRNQTPYAVPTYVKRRVNLQIVVWQNAVEIVPEVLVCTEFRSKVQQCVPTQLLVDDEVNLLAQIKAVVLLSGTTPQAPGKPLPTNSL